MNRPSRQLHFGADTIDKRKLTGGEISGPPEMQEIYFKKGLSKTKSGNHPKRLAVDFNFFIDNTLMYEHELITELGQYWESLSPLNRWGGALRTLITQCGTIIV